MRTTPATSAEVDIWLAVLYRSAHLYRVEPGPDRTWTVQRRRHSRPGTLHHPVLAMDWIENLLADVHQREAELDR